MKPNLTCSGPCFCVFDVGRLTAVSRIQSEDWDITVDVMGANFLMKKEKNVKMGRKQYLTFYLQTLLSIAVCVGRMKVVSPYSVWRLRYEPWQGNSWVRI
jgi:hypothetical protein